LRGSIGGQASGRHSKIRGVVAGRFEQRLHLLVEVLVGKLERQIREFEYFRHIGSMPHRARRLNRLRLENLGRHRRIGVSVEPA
jgi:hypothetical protein